MPYNAAVYVAMFFLLIFWSIPVAAIQALANLETIFATFHADVYDYFSERKKKRRKGDRDREELEVALSVVGADSDAVAGGDEQDDAVMASEFDSYQNQ